MFLVNWLSTLICTTSLSSFLHANDLDTQVDDLRHDMAANGWRQYYTNYRGDDVESPLPYTRESVADKSQRERRLQLEKQLAGMYACGTYACGITVTGTTVSLAG